MEQIEITKNLSKEEKKNVYLAVAVGCLDTICGIVPGAPHKKKKRVCQELRQSILQDVIPQIPHVKPHNLELFKTTITASSTVLDNIMKDNKEQEVHILLNLVGFCLNELPAKKAHWEKYNSLFELWKTAMQYHLVKSGERIFERIDSEVQILVAQRGGVIL